MAVQSAPLWLRKADIARAAPCGGESGVQSDLRDHHAQTIRADDAHVAAPRFRQEFVCSSCHALGTDFLEAGGNDDRARTPAFTHSWMMPGTVLAGVQMTAEINFFRDGGDIRDTL